MASTDELVGRVNALDTSTQELLEQVVVLVAQSKSAKNLASQSAAEAADAAGATAADRDATANSKALAADHAQAASASSSSATSAAGLAAEAANVAAAAAERMDDLIVSTQQLQSALLISAGVSKTVLSYADALAALPALPVDGLVRVLVDETLPGYSAWYQKSNGALALRLTEPLVGGIGPLLAELAELRTRLDILEGINPGPYPAGAVLFDGKAVVHDGKYVVLQ